MDAILSLIPLFLLGFTAYILLYMHDLSKKFHLASIEHWPRPRLECRTGGKKLHSALNGTLELDHGAHGHFEAHHLLTICKKYQAL